MKRGRILLLLILIIIIGAVGILLFLGPSMGIDLLGNTTNATPTPSIRYIDVVVAGQYISRAAIISEEQLSTIQIPETAVYADMITNPYDVVGKLAKYPLEQGVPISRAMLAESILQVAQTGSEAAKLVPQGMTAISIPISRLNSVAYAIRDGDHINLIATMLFIDLDPNTQSSLPNIAGSVKRDLTTGEVTLGGDGSPQGRVELEPTLNVPLYIVPSESQRPRLVSQMIMQDIQVLHVGTFELPSTDENVQAVDLAATPTPQPQQAEGQVVTSERPDIITLVVSPQDAVTLTYLIYHGAQLTLTLRGIDDTARIETEAATLQFLLSQYGIPVPAKLPYGITPTLEQLAQPFMPNDAIVR